MEETLGALLSRFDKLARTTPSGDKNLFEMVDLKEFRHSSILGYLLGLEDRGGYRANLASFLEELGLRDESGTPWLNTLPCDCSQSTDVWCEKTVNGASGPRPIDILCRIGSRYLIIENKCKGAGDQTKQIEDYWNGVVRDFNASPEDVYVLYLPAVNESERPSSASLGSLERRFDDGDLKGQLIVRSYRNLVLPWLERRVLPRANYGAGALVRSLQVYIDLLKVRYGVACSCDDARFEIVREFAEKSSIDPQDYKMVWDVATGCLGVVDDALDRNRTKRSLSDCEIEMASALQRSLWAVRSFAREQNPWLDDDNFGYEVYWLLRNNPTPYAAKFMRRTMNSDLFFKGNAKRSLWDSINYGGHVFEVVCEASRLASFIATGECEGPVLRFGTNCTSDAVVDAVMKTTETHMVKTEGWVSFQVANSAFSQAYQFVGKADYSGGELLWRVAELIEDQTRLFAKAIRAVVDGGVAG